MRAHFAKLATGETVVWGAFDGETNEMVGMITAEVGSGYWLETGAGPNATAFINEFVVNPSHRGRRIGVNLTSLSVHPTLGIFGIKPDVKEMYTTVHSGNVTSRTAFIKGGYHEVITYADSHRDRDTTVLKYAPGGYTVMPSAVRGNRRPMRVIGIQSGNAVDGIDVGIFEFDPLVRSSDDVSARQERVASTHTAASTSTRLRPPTRLRRPHG